MDHLDILYVEDEEMYQSLVRQILTEEGFTVQVAGTGEQACRMLEQSMPDLLILDINLPDTDGYTLCQKLRQDEMWATLPILMLTVRRHPEEWRQGFSAGASDYVSKPLNGPDLVERVRSCLDGKVERLEGVTNPEVLMIHAALAGNRGAYDVFVRQYRDQLLKDMLGHAKNIVEAEEVVALAFAQAFERLEKFRGQSSFFTWLYSIAKNELHRKWRKTTVPVPLEYLTDEDQASITRSAEARNPSAPENTTAAQVQLLDEAIGRVPEPYRKMLQWRFVKQLPYADMARRMAVPVGVVRNRLFKAQYLLRDAWRTANSHTRA
jgi:RNA polymerase sigma factor (sigma-70 family)